MALFEDKNKPVNIYAKGTATAKAQEATTNMALSPAKKSLNVLDTVTTPAQSVIKAATQPVRNAMAGQEAALDRQQLRSSFLKTPQGNPASFRQMESPMQKPDISTFRQNEGPSNVITGTPAAQRAGMTGERVVGGNMPGYVPQFGPAANQGVRDAIVKTPQVPMQTVYQNDGNRVYATQQPVRERVMQPQSGRVPGVVTDSGLSIQFTGNVPNAVRQQVMQPMGANDATAQAAREKQNQQFLARQGREPADPNTGLTPGEMALMKPGERFKVNEALAQRDIARRKVGIDEMLATGNLEIGRGKLGVEQGQLGVSKMQAATQGKVADSTIAANQLDMEGKQFAQSQAVEANRRRRELANTTDKDQRKIRQQQLKDMGIIQEQPEKFEFKIMKQPINPDGSGGGEVGYKFGERGSIEQVAGGEQLPPPPRDISAREKNKRYAGPSGAIVWNGKEWVDA